MASSWMTTSPGKPPSPGRHAWERVNSARILAFPFATPWTVQIQSRMMPVRSLGRAGNLPRRLVTGVTAILREPSRRPS